MSKILNNEFILERGLKTPEDFKIQLQSMMDKKILEVNSDNKILTVQENEKMILLYCSLLWPLIECYWVTIVYMISMKSSLNPVHEVDLEKFK